MPDQVLACCAGETKQRPDYFPNTFRQMVLYKGDARHDEKAGNIPETDERSYGQATWSENERPKQSVKHRKVPTQESAERGAGRQMGGAIFIIVIISGPSDLLVKYTLLMPARGFKFWVA
ncbi:hypothetical protein NDU88_007059 [Pleurodeles waltl]|uniref:Uncharacterized protein n=1 Tax=Pleurodeles waltl TaxID=8319 RepID=A0AAV7N4W0_PLEWA|nr:hypothetical protein NDU88_007059 [Pleurodeles waltl]